MRQGELFASIAIEPAGPKASMGKCRVYTEYQVSAAIWGWVPDTGTATHWVLVYPIRKTLRGSRALRNLADRFRRTCVALDLQRPRVANAGIQGFAATVNGQITDSYKVPPLVLAELDSTLSHLAVPRRTKRNVRPPTSPASDDTGSPTPKKTARRRARARRA